MKVLTRVCYFNRCFNAENFYGCLSRERFGLAFYIMFMKRKEEDSKNRFIFIHSPQDWSFYIFALPCFVSALMWFALFGKLISYLFMGDDFYWPVLIILPIYSIFFVNLLGYLKSFKPKKGVYLNRVEQTVSFAWKIDGEKDIPSGANLSFNWEDIVCKQKQNVGSAGSMVSVIELSHHNLESFPNAKMTLPLGLDNTSMPINNYLMWEYIVRYMDISKPLPDSPEFELFRELDPLTAKLDEKNKRPNRFWTQFSLEQQREIEEQIFQEALKFDWSEGKVQPEITKPWEVWTPDPKRPPKPRGMFTMIMLQLVFCYPE
ncbi:hypothetical protein KIJ96_21845 (plasmid) [Pseudoalteromonas piscicida]|nr:hypothetical protein KIJ96_21845 [Pseudoalteromonas piscicida]